VVDSGQIASCFGVVLENMAPVVVAFVAAVENTAPVALVVVIENMGLVVAFVVVPILD